MTGVAAERLEVSIPTLERWIARRTLAGGSFGARWLVSTESIERLLSLRSALLALDRAGNPTSEELCELYVRSRDTGVDKHTAPS